MSGAFVYPEKESCVIGYLVNRGFEGIPKSCIVIPEAFTHGTWGVIYAIARKLHHNGRAVSQISIMDTIQSSDYYRRMMESFAKRDGKPDWRDSVFTPDESMSHNPRAVAEFLDEIGDAHARRKQAKIGQQMLDGKISTDSAIKQLEELVRPNSDSLPDVEDGWRLAGDPPAMPDELVEGVLHQGGKLVFGGGSKSFKTWTLIDLAISVATGCEWLGFATKKGRVLYLNFEIMRAPFSRRLQSVSDAKGIPMNLRSATLDVWNLRGCAASAEIIIPKIIERMRGKDYILVVLDPLYKVSGGRDENGAGDMGLLMNEIERIAVQTGAAVAFGSHFAKGNASAKDSKDRMSGSGVIARDPDSIVTMTPHETPDAFTVEMILRDYPPQDSFVVRRQHPLMVIDMRLDPARLKQPAGRRKTWEASDVLELLRGESLSNADWLRRAKDELGMSEDTFKRRLRDLKRERKVIQSPADGLYYKPEGA